MTEYSLIRYPTEMDRNGPASGLSVMALMAKFAGICIALKERNMTKYYEYRHWVVKIKSPLFGTTKAFIFNLASGEHYIIPVQTGDVHSFICERIDQCIGDSSKSPKGLGALIYLSGRDAKMAQEVFERYF